MSTTQTTVQFDHISFDTVYEKLVIILRDNKNTRWLPIITTESSAQAIDEYVQKSSPVRPSIYEVVVEILRASKISVPKIAITDLLDNTYYSNITLEQNGQLFEIDARPGDAIALALRVQAPIFVSNDILEKAAVPDE